MRKIRAEFVGGFTAHSLNWWNSRGVDPDEPGPETQGKAT
jgi:hypothetical protein